ncbi:ATP-binding protein, partial [Parabacteroides goldsteinii]
MDYSKLQKAEAIPEAASMIETFRAIGYSLETAVADIIDNSISANAKSIYINRLWRGSKSVITIKDDGDGMSSNEIIQAMRPGAQNPLSDRSETDLGRFGLGLKTASFSQCRKLSVLSKRQNAPAAFWSWDLDYVAQSDKWELLQWIPEEFTNQLDDLQSGTLIIWSDLDRVLPL